MSLPAFFAELKSLTRENPLGNDRVFNLESVVDVQPFQGRGHIQYIRALKKRQGAGTRAMAMLTSLADKHGIDLSLFVEPEKEKGNIGKAALTKFYKNHGFVSKGGLMFRKAQVPTNESKKDQFRALLNSSVRLSNYADSIAELMSTTSVDPKVKAAVEEAAFYIALSAMTYNQAKTVLGFSSADNPSPNEIKRAWQKLAMKHHPDRGGNIEMMVEVNVAKDILDGTRKPDRTTGPTTKSSSPPAPEPAYSWKPKRDPSVTLETAARFVGADKIDWLGFFYQRSSGYSGDETSMWTYYYVGVAMDRDPSKIQLGLFTKIERDMGINGGQSTVWSVILKDVKKTAKDLIAGVKNLYTENAKKSGGLTSSVSQTSRFSITTGNNMLSVLEKGTTVPVVTMDDLLSALGMPPGRPKKEGPARKAAVSLHYDRGDDGVMRGGLSLNGGPVHRMTDAEAPAFLRLVKPTWGEYTYMNNPSKVLSRLKQVKAISAFILKHIKSPPTPVLDAVQAIHDAAV